MFGLLENQCEKLPGHLLFLLAFSKLTLQASFREQECFKTQPLDAAEEDFYHMLCSQGEQVGDMAMSPSSGQILLQNPEELLGMPARSARWADYFQNNCKEITPVHTPGYSQVASITWERTGFSLSISPLVVVVHQRRQKTSPNSF